MKRHLFKNRHEWRKWLQENHASASETWLVYFKKHINKRSIKYEEAVEEALCFGWIDSKVKRIDEEKYMQRFTPRKAGSIWSESNKRRVRKLLKLGLITPAGLEKIESAKLDGSWYLLDDIDKEIIIPDDLAAALAENPKARGNFAKFISSHKKQYLWWLKSARTTETREKRLIEIVKRAEENIKPG